MARGAVLLHQGPPAQAPDLTYDQVHAISMQLATQIESSCRKNKEKFDLALLIPRGSYYPGNIITRELNFEAAEIIHACIGSYKLGKTERSTKFTYGQMPQIETVRGKNILVLEEVCETGYTLKHIFDLLEYAGAKLVRAGVLHYKPTRTKTGFVPDWWAREEDRWIVYPWETNEQRGKLSAVKKRLKKPQLVDISPGFIHSHLSPVLSTHIPVAV